MKKDRIMELLIGLLILISVGLGGVGGFFVGKNYNVITIPITNTINIHNTYFHTNTVNISNIIQIQNINNEYEYTYTYFINEKLQTNYYIISNFIFYTNYITNRSK